MSKYIIFLTCSSYIYKIKALKLSFQMQWFQNIFFSYIFNPMWSHFHLKSDLFLLPLLALSNRKQKMCHLVYTFNITFWWLPICQVLFNSLCSPLLSKMLCNSFIIQTVSMKFNFLASSWHIKLFHIQYANPSWTLD